MTSLRNLGKIIFFPQTFLMFKNLQGHLVIPSRSERLLRLLIALQISIYLIEGHAGYYPNSFLTTVKQSIISLLSNNRQTKFQMILKCVFEKTNLQKSETVTTESAFRSVTETILEATNIDELYKKSTDQILEFFDKFQNNGSGWVFKSIVFFRNSHSQVPTPE